MNESATITEQSQFSDYCLVNLKLFRINRYCIFMKSEENIDIFFQLKHLKYASLMSILNSSHTDPPGEVVKSPLSLSSSSPQEFYITTTVKNSRIIYYTMDNYSKQNKFLFRVSLT